MKLHFRMAIAAFLVIATSAGAGAGVAVVGARVTRTYGRGSVALTVPQGQVALVVTVRGMDRDTWRRNDIYLTTGDYRTKQSRRVYVQGSADLTAVFLAPREATSFQLEIAGQPPLLVTVQSPLLENLMVR